jgi:hypothetical protein
MQSFLRSAGFGHRGGVEHGAGQAGSAGAVDKEGMAEELDGGVAALGDGGGVERIVVDDEAHEGDVEEEEDVGAEGGVEDLEAVGGAEFAVADAFVDDGRGAEEHGGEGFLRDEVHGARAVAAMESDHFLLEEGLEALFGEDAVEVLEGEAEDALAGGAGHVEDGEGVACDAGGDLFEGGDVEGFLVAEVVVEEGLIDGGGVGDGGGASAGEAMLAEFADGGVEDAEAGLIGAGLVAFDLH